MRTPREKILTYLSETTNWLLDMQRTYQDGVPKAQSPIEEILIDALTVWTMLHHPGYLRVYGKQCDAETNQKNMVVVPQAEVGQYIVDFLICDTAMTPFVWLAVECDGHQFHEKTKEQAQKDKARDRFILSRGFAVVRFTGSEIYRDPIKCADEIHNILCAESYRLSGDANA